MGFLHSLGQNFIGIPKNAIIHSEAVNHGGMVCSRRARKRREEGVETLAGAYRHFFPRFPCPFRQVGTMFKGRH